MTNPSGPRSSVNQAEAPLGITPPSPTLPKGGGAIRGIGEKFAANPVTGAGSLQIPIATSPGRAGFGPQLVLGYDSTVGNGPFGLGWTLSVPSIVRKTEQGLPRYRDADPADVFVLSNAEDLVPALRRRTVPGTVPDTDTDGDDWELDILPPRTVGGAAYRLQRYRPRIEAPFARIERWTNTADATDSFWRAISRDNVTTWFGRTAESRVADPDDPSRIFSWLACESYDDKGNAVVFRYKEEDAQGVDRVQPHERNRTDRARSANRYLKRIFYGNRVPYCPELSATVWPVLPAAAVAVPAAPAPVVATAADQVDASDDWLFEVVLDYGEHDPDTPLPVDTGTWSVRGDPFSSYRPGFDVRTYRRCRRVLMFHHFDGEPGVGSNCVVRSTDFSYSADVAATDTAGGTSGDPEPPTYSMLQAVSHRSYQRDGTGYRTASLPPLELEYSRARIDDTVREVPPDSLEHLPHGLDSTKYQWVDLDGEGLAGILTEQGGAWFYKRNLSALPPALAPARSACFAPAERLRTMPARVSFATDQQLLDLTGDGRLDVVAFEPPVAGFYERAATDDWETFTPFTSLPTVAWTDPNLRFIDLTGDGQADLLVTEDDALAWYPSLGKAGFGPAERVRHAADEERGPRLVFADSTESIHLADLSGDGLTDLVRIRNGEICYWPNIGYGRFGAKVTMAQAPWLDEPDRFDQKRVILADVDGSGTADLIYLRGDGVDVYFNRSGNGWSTVRRLRTFPPTDELASVAAVDLLGNGTTCLVWSTTLPGEARRPMRYIDLMGGTKPHLLVGARNNLGAETVVEYAPSTKFYLADRAAGRPWITKLPFPVQVVERVVARDKWRKTEFASTFSYHHGYFDPVEGEFRGFGRIEQTDVERYDHFAAGNAASPFVTDDLTLYQPPVKTISWFHTGAFADGQRILTHFDNEYFSARLRAARAAAGNTTDRFTEHVLPEPDLVAEQVTAAEWREALRACKGMLLRQEVYELDVDALHERREHRPVKIFSATSRNCHIRRLQPKAENEHAVFLVTDSETLAYQYDLDLRAADLNPDPRVTHTLHLNVDTHGHVVQSVAAVYPRFGQFGDANLTPAEVALVRSVQAELRVTYSETHYTDDVIVMHGDPVGGSLLDHHRTPVSYEQRAYDLTGVRPVAADGYFTLAELRGYRFSTELQPEVDHSGVPLRTVSELAHHAQPSGAGAERRLLGHTKALFFADDLVTPLPLGRQGRRSLAYETYQLALTDELLAATLGAKLDDVIDANTGATARDALDDATTSGYIRGVDLVARFAEHVPAVELAGQYWQRSGIAEFPADAAAHFFQPTRYVDAFGQVTTLRFDSYDLVVERTTDAAANTVSVVAFDYRMLQPRIMRDANGNLSEVAFDTQGFVVATAVKGKGAEADNLDGFTVDIANPSPGAVAAFSGSVTVDLALARSWLRDATTRIVYHLGETRDAAGNVLAWATRPTAACAIRREVRAAAPGGATSPLQITLECSDGTGGTLMHKRQAEPEPGQPNGPLRWIVEGKTIVNNKGIAVKQYEPYFTATFGVQAVDEAGVTPVMYYDALGRTVRVEAADGTVSRVSFSPWQSAQYDANDTVRDPGNRWYERRSVPTASLEAQRAASLAAAHRDTPSRTIFDSSGSAVVTVAHNRVVNDAGTTVDQHHLTFTKLDAQGRTLWIRDARGNPVIQRIQPPTPDGQVADPTTFAACYDLAGNLLFEHGMDTGDRWTLYDAGGDPLVSWDRNRVWDAAGSARDEDRLYRTDYDALRRPTAVWLTVAGTGGPPALIEQFVYGESLADATDRNLRGSVYRHYDSSGRTETEQLDFNGNLRRVRRRLARAFDAPLLDWRVSPETQLEDETFTLDVEYDALDRPTRLYNWHRGIGSRVTVYEPSYNARGALARQAVTVRATRTATGHTVDPVRPAQTVIEEIVYNARGQTELVRYGNGTVTRQELDPESFRVREVRTTRPGYNPTFPGAPDALKDARVLQHLFYDYDAVGNVVAVRDDAVEPTFFRNQQVDAESHYTYDALYRLVAATGRESAAATGAPGQVEVAPGRVQFPVTAKTLRPYAERYEYDAVGNVLEIRHTAGPTGSWTRHYEYAASGNRLLRSWQGNDTAAATRYEYDLHGNTLNLLNVMPSAFFRWDHRDMIRTLDLGGGGRAHYNYDSGQRRTRKVIATRAGAKQWERLDLGGMECYRRYAGGTLVEEIESFHVTLNDRRVLLIEDVLQTDNAALGAKTVYRYQYADRVGSVSLELDDAAEILGYEEHHPFGTTAFRAGHDAVEVSPRRFRYTGMERDEESGLNYHVSRYYAPWLARWVSADQAGLVDGPNLYAYCRNGPIGGRDGSGHQTQPQTQPLHTTRYRLDDTVKQAPNSTYRKLYPREIEVPTDENQEAPAEMTLSAGIVAHRIDDGPVAPPPPEPPLSRPPLVQADVKRRPPPPPPRRREPPPPPPPPPEPTPVPKPVPMTCPPGMIPTKSGRACYEPIEAVQKRWKDDEDKEFWDGVNLFVDTTLTDGMENVSTVTGWLGTGAKLIPGGQGVALGLEFVGLAADVANTTYVVSKSLLLDRTPDGASQLVTKGIDKGADLALKQTKKIAVKKLQKKYPMIPEPILEKMVDEALGKLIGTVSEAAGETTKEQLEERLDEPLKKKSIVDQLMPTTLAP